MSSKPAQSAGAGRPLGPSDDPSRYRLGGRVEGAVTPTWYALHRREELTFEVRIEVHGVASAEAARGLQRRFLWAADLAAALDDPSAVPPRDLFLATVPADVSGSAASGWAVCSVSTWNEAQALDDWADAHPDRSASDVFRLVADLVRVIGRLHAGVGGIAMAHRNLNPTAVSVVDGHLRLGGVGTARPLRGDTEGYPGLEAPWAPPELAEGAPFTAASDAWGIGALTVCAFTGEAPATDLSAVAAALVASPALGGGGDVALHITSLLAPDPDDRPSDLGAWADELADMLGVSVDAVELGTARGADASASEVISRATSGERQRPAPVDSSDAPASRSLPPVFIAAAAAIAVLAGVIGFVAGRSGSDSVGSEADAATSSTTTGAPASTTTAAPTVATVGPPRADSFDDRDAVAGGPLGWEVTNGEWEVADGSARPVDTPVGTSAIAVIDGGGPDLRVRASVEGLATGAGIVFRYESLTDYFSLVYLPTDGAPGEPYKVLHVTSEAVDIIGSFGGAFGSQVDMGVDLVGEDITVIIAGAARGTVSDPDGAGRPTVGVAAVAGAEASYRVASFSVTPLAGA